MEVDKQVSDIAVSLEKIRSTLEGHTASFADLKTWKQNVDAKVSDVDSKVADLSTSVTDLRHQIERITLHHQDHGSAYKVFDTEEIDLTKPVGAHLVTSPSGAASGPIMATAMQLTTGGLVMEWSPLCNHLRSQVRIPPLT